MKTLNCIRDKLTFSNGRILVGKAAGLDYTSILHDFSYFLAVHLSNVCATGIAPFGVIPVELVRYFHVSISVKLTST